MSGLDQLMDCVALVLSKVENIEHRLKADEGVRAPDLTAPVTAKELCARWAITAESEALALNYLRRRCRAYGLKPLRGTRGWEALYARADVLHAESYAAGDVTRRRHAS